MITLLERLFIRDRENTSSPQVRQAYGMLCGIVGITLNLLLSGMKFIAGLLSGSIAITADAFNNLSDAGSSVVTLIGFRMAGQKADSDHPFGHGRYEYISGFVVSVIILIMAIELLQSSVEKIFHPQELTYSPVILWILVISILVKIYMACYNTRIGKKLGAPSMRATAADSLSDTAATSVVLAATLISHYSGISVDGCGGLLVGFFILFAGIGAARDTINPLLGQAPDPTLVRRIEEIVLSYDQVLGVHDLIVHNYGPGRLLISLHAEVPADGDLLELHDMIDLIEHRLRHELSCSAVIHMDPICIHDALTLELKGVVENILREIDECLTMHDFRVTAGPTHTNLIFDVVSPYNFRYTDEELSRLIFDRIQTYDNSYFSVIEIDKKYS